MSEISGNESGLRNLKTLAAEWQEKAKKELNEDPIERHAAIQALKEAFARENPDLKLEREDDLFIIRFLRARKFDQKRALELLNNYHKFPLEHQKAYISPHEATAEHAKKLFDTKIMGILPKRAKNGSVVLYIDTGKLDPTKLNQKDLQLGTTYMVKRLLNDEVTQICGITFLEDLEDFSLMNTMKFNDSVDQELQFHYLQHCMPLRLKGIHALHQPLYVSIFMAIVRPFMSTKLSKRIFFHGSKTEELGEFFEMEFVPKEVGGKLNFDFHATFQTLDEFCR